MSNQATALADLVTRQPEAAAVLSRFGLDFCCGGQQSLEAACAEAGVDPRRVEAALARADGLGEPHPRWDRAPLPALVEHILSRYHRPLRRELPALLALARTVTRVHAGRPECPRGLVEHLSALSEELERHLEKEELLLFPRLLDGEQASLALPARALRAEHEQLGADLRRTRALTADLTPPADACASWRALYRQLARLEEELKEHTHLENHVLFPRLTAEPGQAATQRRGSGHPALVLLLAIVVGVLLLGLGRQAWAHCDSMDGPVVREARAALARADVTAVLKWVPPAAEAEVRTAFARALAARGKAGAADEQATGFFETLVRLHRAGEGAPYLGLAPVGTPLPPAVAATDQALAGKLPPAEVTRLLLAQVEQAVASRYAAAAAARTRAETSVAAGREYVARYVELVHTVEQFAELAARPANAHASHHEGQPLDGHPAASAAPTGHDHAAATAPPAGHDHAAASAAPAGHDHAAASAAPAGHDHAGDGSQTR